MLFSKHTSSMARSAARSAARNNTILAGGVVVAIASTALMPVGALAYAMLTAVGAVGGQRVRDVLSYALDISRTTAAAPAAVLICVGMETDNVSIGL